jgi:hypothetical protein
MNALIEQCRRLGVRLRVEGGALAYDAPKGAMTSELAAALKAHKPAILAALAEPDPLWWRVAITEAGGRTIEVDAPSGWTLPRVGSLCPALPWPGRHGHVDRGTAQAPACRPPAAALAAACEGVKGITPAEYRSLLSPEFWAKSKPPPLGVHVNDLTDHLRKEIRSNRGVVVEVVVKGSPAFDADIMHGDIITRTNDEVISDAQSFGTIVGRYAGQEVILQTYRDGQAHDVPVRLNRSNY